MTVLDLTAFALAVAGLGFAGLGLMRYSDFLSRMHQLSPASVEPLSLDTTENWSSKNWRIAGYFLQRRYLGVDTELNKLGNSVRRCNLISVALVILAMLVLAAKSHG